MSDTLLTSLSNTLRQFPLVDVARHLGESEQTIARGLELSASAIFSGLAHKADNSELMRQVIGFASKSPVGVTPNPAQPQSAEVRNLLSSVFGGQQETIINSLSRESGLRTAAASSVLAMGAQSVLSFLGTRIREEGMTATGLAGFLHSQSEKFRSALPAGFRDTLVSHFNSPRSTNPVVAQAIDTNPVIAQKVVGEKSNMWWLWLLGLAVLLGILGYILSRPNKPAVDARIPVPAVAGDLGNFVQRQLPDGVQLNVPEKGVEGRLLAFIQDPNRTPDKTTWFDFDRLLFDTGSATLQPQSREQLNNIAAILKAYPNVHLKIGGYTDNTGSPEQNQKLSQDRAAGVMSELVALGISQDRLAAEGYGEDHPVASNSTEETRAQNRRISMLVTQK